MSSLLTECDRAPLNAAGRQTELNFERRDAAIPPPRRIPRTFRAVDIVIVRREPIFRRPAIGRSNGILLFIQHRSFCPATATVGAKSLVLLPVIVLEIEAGFRKVGALLPCGTRSPQAHRYPRPSRHVPPLTQHCIPPRADGSTAPHGLQPHCFAFLYQAPPAQRRGAHGDAARSESEMETTASSYEAVDASERRARHESDQ